MMTRTRIVSLALSAAMTAMLAAGCGSSSAGTPEPSAAASSAAPVKQVTLKIWGGVPAENGPDKVCEEFSKAFESKGIKAVYERFVNDDNGNLKLDTALLAGEDVDLFVNYALAAMKKRVSANVATDLTPYLKKDNMDLEKDIGPIAREYYIDNKPYAIPTALGTNNAWIVNKDMFDAAGIPLPTDWTLDELRSIAAKLTKGEGASKVYGVLFPTDNDKMYAFNFAASKLGPDLLYKDGKETESQFDSPDILSAVKTVTDMMLKDKTAVSHADMVTQKLVPSNLFTEGKVAISGHAWIVRDVKNLEKFPHKFKTAFVPAPKLDKDQKDMYAMGGLGDYISVSAKSTKKDQAWEYLKWYTSKGMISMVPGGRIPAYKSFDKDAIAKTFFTGSENVFDEKTFKDIFLKTYDKYQIAHIMTKLPEMQQIGKEETEKAMSGAVTPEAAMKSAKKRGDDILKK